MTSTRKKMAWGALSVFAAALVAFVVFGTRRPRRYAPAAALLRRPAEDVWLERAEDGELRAHWSGPARGARVFAGEHPSAIDRVTPVAATAPANLAELGPAHGGERRYFEVAFDDGERLLVAERFVPLAGAVNLRDIGGYRTADGRRVRWGRVYRSGGLADLTADDLPALAGLGLKVVLDLRTPKEAGRYPDRLPGDVTYLNQPAYSDGNTAAWLRTLLFRRAELDEVMAENYVHLADTRAEYFGGLLRRLAEPDNQPALLHCTAGKDRTGLAIAFLLLVLGVPEDVVVADYSLSNLAYDQIMRAAREDVQRLRAIGITPEELRPVMSADPASLERLLDHLRARYGSVEAYLRDAAGVSAEVGQRLRDQLLL